MKKFLPALVIGLALIGFYAWNKTQENAKAREKERIVNALAAEQAAKAAKATAEEAARQAATAAKALDERRAYLQTPAGKRELREQAAVEEAQRRAGVAGRAAAGKGARVAYGETLRNNFLDKQMDIKVSVTGVNSEKLHLTFVLFDDVWVHNFEKGDLVKEIRGKGFDEVSFSDGYDYGVSFTWSRKK